MNLNLQVNTGHGRITGPNEVTVRLALVLCV